MALYRDRQDAAQKLLAALPEIELGKAVVLALPRGGVPIGAVIAKALNAPLDLILVRKVGAPDNPELALAAVTGPDHIAVNDHVLRAYGVSQRQLQNLATPQIEEIQRRRDLYLGGKPPVSLAGKTAIVVDDGIATGATARAALQALEQRRPARVILAVPVSSADVLDDLGKLADEVICPAPHLTFGAVGAAYDSFPQVADTEVAALLRAQDGGARSAPD